MSKVDVVFRITGTEIPADHGYLLLSAVSRVVPQVHGDDHVGIHPISGRRIADRRLSLTEYSALTVRIDAERISDVLPLAGRALDLAGCQIGVGVPQTRALVPAARLYSRLVVIKGFLEPEPFLEAVRRQLAQLAIRAAASLVPQPEVVAANRERVSGSHSPFVRRTLQIRDKQIVGFAVRVEDLSAEESLRLQETGLGGRRRFGCGVFVPDRT